MAKMIPEKGPISFISNRNGVFFLEAPMPRKWHRCKVQTSARTIYGTIHKCACGASRVGRVGWSGKNTRIVVKEKP